MIAVAAVLAGSNIHFWWKLRQSRKALDIAGVPLKVYLTDYVATPCLFGLGKPDIYLTGEVMTDSQMRRHVLAHEMSHYRQGDHIWSVLRSLCLILHWYNPLVWAAAILSKQDAELACDEATIKSLGEDERTAYGRTLIGMTCVRRDPRSLMLTATTMLGTKKTLKDRISLIARKPRTALYTLIACVLVAALAVGCTFTGAPTEPTEPSTEPTTEPTVEPTTEPTEEPPVEPTESQNPPELMDKCRQALEELQSRDSFELLQELSGNTPEDLIAYQTTRYIHHGADWIHIKEGSDSTQMYLQDGNRQYVKYITSSIPEEDRVYTTWTEVDLSNDPFASHCWVMDLQWDSDRTVFHKEESNGSAQEIFVYVYHEDDTRELFTFRFDLNTDKLLSVTRIEYDDDGYMYSNRVSVVDSSPEEHSLAIMQYALEMEMENTEDQLLIEQFQNLLTNEEWLFRIIGCVFDQPEDIALEYLFYRGLPYEEQEDPSLYSQAEIDFLKDQLRDTFWGEDNWVNANKFPAERLDEILNQYLGVSLDEVQIPERWYYYPEADAYYDVRSDAYIVTPTVTKVNIGEYGEFYVYWTTEFIRDTRSEELSMIDHPQMVTVLRENEDGTYRVLMNMPVSYDPLANTESTE